MTNHITIYWTDLNPMAQESIRKMLREGLETDKKEEIDAKVKERFDEAGMIPDLKRDKGWLDGTRELVLAEMIDNIITYKFKANGEI